MATAAATEHWQQCASNFIVLGIELTSEKRDTQGRI